jgi:hypothetical protein
MMRLIRNPTPNDWLPLLLVVGVMGLVDLVMAPLATLEDNPKVAFVFTVAASGLVLAQGVLLSLAVVFGSGPFWLRLVVGWAAGFCALGCWLLGLSLVTRAFTLRDLIQLIAFIAFLALAGQIPLWLTRVVYGWRFISADTIASRTEQQFSLADMSASTALICITIGVIRAAIIQDSSEAAPEELLALGVAAIAVIGFATLFVLPIVAIFFSEMTMPMAWTVAIGYSMLPVIVFALPVGALIAGGVALPIVGLVMVAAVSCASGIGAACTLMCCCGVRWDTPQNEKGANILEKLEKVV